MSYIPATEELQRSRIPKLIRCLESISKDKRYRSNESRERAVQRLCESELKYLRDLLEIREDRDESGLGQKVIGKVNSLHSYLTSYRNAVKEIELSDRNSFEKVVGRVGERRVERSHMALKYLVKSPLEKQQRGERDVAQKREKVRNRIVLNPTPLIERADEILDGKSYIAIALGLVLLTGRRPIEVLKCGRFSKVDGGLKFSGQAKTKGSSQSRDDYEIPCLTHPERVVEALSRIRQMKDFSSLDNRQVNRKTAKSTREQFDRYFRDVYDTSLPPYSLRAAYAAICWKRFGQLECDDDQYYLSQIMGHSDDDDDTARYYKRFKI